MTRLCDLCVLTLGLQCAFVIIRTTKMATFIISVHRMNRGYSCMSVFSHDKSRTTILRHPPGLGVWFWVKTVKVQDRSNVICWVQKTKPAGLQVLPRYETQQQSVCDCTTRYVRWIRQMIHRTVFLRSQAATRHKTDKWQVVKDSYLNVTLRAHARV